MVKKKNKIVGLINIILGVLWCIALFLRSSCIKMEYETYIYFTNEQDTMKQIFTIMILIPVVFVLIINLIYIFKN